MWAEWAGRLPLEHARGLLVHVASGLGDKRPLRERSERSILTPMKEKLSATAYLIHANINRHPPPYGPTDRPFVNTFNIGSVGGGSYYLYVDWMLKGGTTWRYNMGFWTSFTDVEAVWANLNGLGHYNHQSPTNGYLYNFAIRAQTTSKYIAP